MHCILPCVSVRRMPCFLSEALFTCSRLGIAAVHVLQPCGPRNRHRTINGPILSRLSGLLRLQLFTIKQVSYSRPICTSRLLANGISQGVSLRVPRDMEAFSTDVYNLNSISQKSPVPIHVSTPFHFILHPNFTTPPHTIFRFVISSLGSNRLLSQVVLGRGIVA